MIYGISPKISIQRKEEYKCLRWYLI